MSAQKEVLQVIVYLNAAVSNIRLYAADHPQVIRNLEKTLSQLYAIFNHQPEITLLLVDDDLVVGNQALTSTTPQLEQFTDLLKQCAVDRITFTDDLKLEGLMRLAKDMAASGKGAVRSVPGATLGKVKAFSEQALDSRADQYSSEIMERLEALAGYRTSALDDLTQMYHQIKDSRQISESGLGEIVKGFLDGMLYNINPLQMLASLKSSDEYTFTHAINVCILTMAQAESLGIRGELLHDIGIAASMHDAGKMFVPDDILNKPDKLTDAEWKHMREHSQHGARYILRLEGIPKLAFLAALEHHIRYDGTGYPDMGANWRPNIVSQMIAIADLFDAMRSRRPYKEPKPDKLIIKILREDSGTAYNPQLVENFLRLIKA